MTNNKEAVEVKNNENFSIDEVLEKERVIAPLVDIYENEDDFVMITNMPGVSRDNVQLKLEEGSLIIFGKINYEETYNRKYVLNENDLGNFYRKFRISDSIDESKIEAKFENGQLIVKLPKHDRIKPRTISIK